MQVFVSISLKNSKEITGISFEIIWKNSHDELADAMNRQEIDLISTIPNDYTLSSSLSVILTNPFISSSAYWLKSINEVENPEILFHFVSSNIPFYSLSEMKTTIDIESDLQKMNDEGTVSIFCDPHITAYYMALRQFDNIEVQSVTDVLSELCFGVGRHIDVNIIGMLNRTIRYLDSYEVDEIIFNHTSVKPEYSIFDFFRDHAYRINTVLLFCATLIVISVHNTSKKFRELSRRDSLTKLYNAGYFHEYSEQKIPTLSKGTLFLIDIDYFKDVNDTYGHHQGDEVIKQVAKNLQKYAPTDSLQGRLGGDEFAILIEKEISIEELENSCKLFLDAMSNNESKIPVTLSIGAFTFESSYDYKTLYKNADKVLYKVKEDGRNGFLILNSVEGL